MLALALELDKYGRADVLVNDAGIMAAGPRRSARHRKGCLMIRINLEILTRASARSLHERSKRKNQAS